MTNRLSVPVIALVALLAVTTVHAQTLPYDHVHLSASDPARAADWYVKYIGGVRVQGAPQVRFGDTLLSFRQADKAPPSEGTVIDHIGFSFPNLDLKLKELESVGVKITSPARTVEGLFSLAFAEDPFGVRLELVQDLETLGFHHIHLRATDPEAMFKWVSDAFGGERTKLKGRLEALKYPGSVWLLVSKANEAPKPSLGAAIDHLGWKTTNLDQTAAALKAKGVKFTTEPRDANNNLRISFVEGPDGLRVEVLQRPATGTN